MGKLSESTGSKGAQIGKRVNSFQKICFSGSIGTKENVQPGAELKLSGRKIAEIIQFN
jgi:hypothetical protein